MAGPYGNLGRPNSLLEAYIEWRDDRLARVEEGLMEADTRADFPEFLYGPIRTSTWGGYTRIQPQYRRYARVENAPDFRERRLRGLNALRGVGYVGEHGEYPMMRRTERPSAPLVVEKYGGVYSITWEAIVNDESGDLLNRNPADMGYAMGLLVAETGIALLESNPTAADGDPFFSVGRGNEGSAALSEDALADAIAAMESQFDDDGYRIVVRPAALIVQNARNEMIARRIINSTVTGTQVEYTGGTPGVGSQYFDKGTLNPLNGIMPGDAVVREPFLSDSNNWYLFADPNDVPAFAVGFLNGQEQPMIGLKNPEVRNALGPGVDPYTFELDTVDFKIRHVFGWAAVDPRGAWRSVVA
jgi:hypothetical protein